MPPARRGWLPLLTGVAVATAVTQVTGVETGLKWPNDLLAADAKLAGILAEAAGDAVVVGIGLNVSTEPAEFTLLALRPRRAARHLPARGRRDRAWTAPGCCSPILAWFERWYQAWQQAGGDPDRSGLRPNTARLVRHDRPHRPGRTPRWSGALRPGRRRRFGRQAAGPALVRDAEVAVAAGDVVHPLSWPAGPGRRQRRGQAGEIGHRGTR